MHFQDLITSAPRDSPEGGSVETSPEAAVLQPPHEEESSIPIPEERYFRFGSSRERAAMDMRQLRELLPSVVDESGGDGRYRVSGDVADHDVEGIHHHHQDVVGAGLHTLAVELLVEIFGWLEARDLVAVSCSCRRWHSVVSRHDEILWRRLGQRDYWICDQSCFLQSWKQVLILHHFYHILMATYSNSQLTIYQKKAYMYALAWERGAYEFMELVQSEKSFAYNGFEGVVLNSTAISLNEVDNYLVYGSDVCDSEGVVTAAPRTDAEAAEDDDGMARKELPEDDDEQSRQLAQGNGTINDPPLWIWKLDSLQVPITIILLGITADFFVWLKYITKGELYFS